LPGTLAIHTAAIFNGAEIIRVHDLKEAVQTARVTDRLKDI
jgi:dihydropteroate synthase